MNNIYQAVSIRLMKMLKRICRGFRVDWSKLFLFAAFTLTFGALTLTCIHPFPFNELFLVPPVVISTHRFSNTNEIPNSTIHVKQNNLPLVRVVRVNSSNELTPSAPVVEIRAKVSSRGRNARINIIKKPVLQEPKVELKPRKGSPLQRHIWALSPDKALLYARKEIESAPMVAVDPELYAPLFRNLSMFKRSYELMESVLKVYIYQEGKRPIFHHPRLQGIYASEGWFMKLMEENRQFVTKDPKKAHLFYLPYSARQMQRALYVPNSHNMRPLSIYLRNYVNMISGKYPFWNNTRGADHFLVACHDWGPYTVTEHEELSQNAIKALCNADLSEKIFVAGKDVSLPETTIRNPKNPHRNVGGKRVSHRPILAFFAGKMHGTVRPTLLKHWGGKDNDMRIYGPLSNKISKNMSYIEHMKSSRYCLCPKGFEVNSPRIVEAIYYECVPVIIADNFVLPFDEVLDWSSFSVIVAEKDIPNLKDILLAIPMRQYMAMQINIKRLQKHFLWNQRPTKYDVFHMILHSIWFNRLNQIEIHSR